MPYKNKKDITAYSKAYREAKVNKEEKKTYNKAYYEANKEILNAKKRYIVKLIKKKSRLLRKLIGKLTKKNLRLLRKSMT